MPASPSCLALLATLCLLVGAGPEPARAAPDTAGAAATFALARAVSERDGGRLWGQRLYGPMLIVDPTDLAAIANQPDGAGALKPAGGVFAGVLPPSVTIADTPVDWSGTRWTELLWPLFPKGDTKATVGEDWRPVLLAHEMFHRIQPALGLTRPEIANVHLDTRDGRTLLQLEWRALARALTAPAPAPRRAAIADALLFRAERYRLFPAAPAAEAALEIDEGIAEYTGVRLGLQTPEARTRYAVYDLSAFLAAPSFVRAFAYATGPAYGLLLDGADPAWRGRLATGARLDRLLAAAMRLPPPDFAMLGAREAEYDPGRRLYDSELRRDRAQRMLLATLTARLVSGPVLRLPMRHAEYGFNPQTLKPLAGYGTVYPTLHLSDDWGVLQVDSGGALLDTAMTTATVSAAGADVSARAGNGWRLALKPGWAVRAGPRKGDMVVSQQGSATAPSPR